MRFPGCGARSAAVLRGATVWLVVLAAGTASAAFSLDRSGRFAIQWWSVDDGLPEAPVNGVAFAADGLLYCTSPTRIARFDGISFDPLPTSLTDPVREAIGGFSNLGFDRQGRLWVQGGSAVAMLDDVDRGSGRRRWRVHVHPLARFNSLAFTADGRPVLVGPNVVLAFDGSRFREVAAHASADAPVAWRYGDVDPTTGDLWLWGNTQDPGRLLRAAMPPRASSGLRPAADAPAGGDVISLSFCPEGPLALLPDCGVIRGPDGWRRLPPDLPDADYRRSGKIARSVDGTVWVSSHNGIIACRDGVAERVTSGLPGFSLRTGAIVGDRQGGMWAACFGGLLAVRRTPLHVQPVTDCRAVFERADGTLYAGSPGSVSLLDPESPHDSRVVGTLSGASVPTALVEDAAGRLWVGTQDNFILRIEDGRVEQVTKPAEPFRELRNINALVRDTRDRIWAATANGLAIHDETTDAFRTLTAAGRGPQPVVIGLAAEDDGSVLAATQGRGVERFTADGSGRLLLPAADMPGRRMIVFRRDSRGGLWVGGDRGLVRVRDGAPPLRLSTATGIVDEAIRLIEEDRTGRLWIATRSGHLQGIRLDDVDALERGDATIVRGVILGPLDGIGDVECIGRVGRASAAGDPRRDRITVPVSNGILRFDPAAVTASQGVSAAPTVSLAKGPPPAFRFATPGMRWGADVLHQTRLRGVDPGWSTATPAGERDYAQLPPGDHVFEVRSLSGETDTDFPLTSLAVRVPTPWWRRPATVVALGAIVAGLAAAVGREAARRRSRRVIAALEWQRAMDHERARIARDIHDGLGAGLTRMAMMSDLARKGATPQAGLPDRLDAIYRTARSLARSVDEIVWAVNPRNDTVSRFLSYVVNDVEEFVHAGDLSLRLDVPDGPTDDRLLPTHVRHHLCLAIREALQNVLRHADARHVDFSIRLAAGTLVVAIRDDGIGFSTAEPTAAEQDGLANMRHRIAEIGGRVEVESAAGSGTSITFHVPFDIRRRIGDGPTPEMAHDA
ncbi:MAG: two-component regulator propeller domain-containing protein [Planctomycetaceae bacterium]